MDILDFTTTKLKNKIQLLGNCKINNILIIGVFHGDEPQGDYLINKYIMQNKKKNLNANNLLFIPCLNPDGKLKGTRTNANGVDLNRNFPTKNWGQDTSLAGENPLDYYGGDMAASEVETRFILRVLEKYSPKAVLTLHSPYKVVNYDGPAEELAQKIASIMNYPVESSIGYPTPGSFGTYCGIERNIPTITLELDEKIPVANLEQPVFKVFDLLENITFS